MLRNWSGHIGEKKNPLPKVKRLVGRPSYSLVIRGEVRDNRATSAEFCSYPQVSVSEFFKCIQISF